MDINLIYTNEESVERGYLNDVSIDITFAKSSSDSNDFELSMDVSNYDLAFRKGSYFYTEEATEIGGIIDVVSVDTSSETVTLTGVTWRGLLDTIYIQPPNEEEAYYSVSGEANTIIEELLFGQFDGLYVVDDVGSSDIIVDYDIRDISILQAIEKMLYYATPSAKLDIAHYEGKVHVKAVLIQDLSELVQYDETYGVEMIATTAGYSYNHILALGSGELVERLRLNIYMTDTGSWSVDPADEQFVGLEKRMYKYDATNIDDIDELQESAISAAEGANSTDTIALSFDSDAEALFDMVGVKEDITGIWGTEQITSKLVKGTITDGKANVSVTYDVGE
ncbi:MAG: hypothetical protein R3Y58_12240 [Eubacteriales bacterium]